MKKILILTCLIITLAACKKDKHIDSSDPSKEEIEVNFNSDILSSEVQAMSSRAPLTGNIPVGEHVGIFGLNAITTSPSDYTLSNATDMIMSNIGYEVIDKNGSLKCINGNRYTYPNDGVHDGMSFYAYYPLQETARGGKIDIEYKQNNNIDYLYTGQVMKVTSIDPVELHFRHAMSRIIVKVKNKTKNTITDVANTIFFNRFPTKGKLDIENGTVSIIRENPNADIYDNASEIAPGTTQTVSDNIVFPGTIIDELQCTINGSDIQTKSKIGITMERGKYVTVTLVYEPKEPYFISRVEDWTNQGNIDFVIKDEK